MASRTRALSGKDANFLIGKYDYSAIFSMVGLGTTRDKADVTVLRDKGKAYVAGHFDGTLRLNGIFSAVEDAVLQSYVEEASEPIGCTLVLGTKKLDRAKLAQMVASEYAIDTPVEDKAGINGAGQASGLMHHCVAITDVLQEFTQPTEVALTDHTGAAEFIDLGDAHKWKRIRLHLHVTARGAGLTAVNVKIRSSAAVTGNALSGAGIETVNGAAGVNAISAANDGIYVFEFKAPEGQTVARYWDIKVTPAGGTAKTTMTAAFGRSQE